MVILEENVMPDRDPEHMLWEGLELDPIYAEFGGSPFSTSRDPMFGTGSTHNKCYACSSNSAKTHGCGTCCS